MHVPSCFFTRNSNSTSTGCRLLHLAVQNINVIVQLQCIWQAKPSVRFTQRSGSRSHAKSIHCEVEVGKFVLVIMIMYDDERTPACLIGSCCASHAFVQIPPVMREVRVRLREAEVAPLRQRTGRAAGDATGQRHRDLPKLVRLLCCVRIELTSSSHSQVEDSETINTSSFILQISA